MGRWTSRIECDPITEEEFKNSESWFRFYRFMTFLFNPTFLGLFWFFGILPFEKAGEMYPAGISGISALIGIVYAIFTVGLQRPSMFIPKHKMLIYIINSSFLAVMGVALFCYTMNVFDPRAEIGTLFLCFFTQLSGAGIIFGAMLYREQVVWIDKIRKRGSKVEGEGRKEG